MNPSNNPSTSTPLITPLLKLDNQIRFSLVKSNLTPEYKQTLLNIINTHNIHTAAFNLTPKGDHMNIDKNDGYKTSNLNDLWISEPKDKGLRLQVV